MKIEDVTYYICQYCGEKFTTKKECKEHEANEMNITIEEYEELETLEEAERETSSALASASNQELRDAQDKAIHDVIEFRKEHHLDEDGELTHIWR